MISLLPTADDNRLVEMSQLPIEPLSDVTCPDMARSFPSHCKEPVDPTKESFATLESMPRKIPVCPYPKVSPTSGPCPIDI